VRPEATSEQVRAMQGQVLVDVVVWSLVAAGFLAYLLWETRGESLAPRLIAFGAALVGAASGWLCWKWAPFADVDHPVLVFLVVGGAIIALRIALSRPVDEP
jgi:hypothetical protein